MGQEVATQGAAGNTAVAVVDYGEFAGAGFENTSASDFKPSYLKVLQPGSPEVETVPSAKPGMILDSITKECYTEVVFIPAWQEHVYAAWKPRTNGAASGGKSFGGVYPLNHPEVQAALKTLAAETGGDKFARNEEGKIILPEITKDGEVYQLIETRYYHGVQVLDSGVLVPATIAFFSTGLPGAGDWLNIMNRQTIPGTTKPKPLFAHAFKLSLIKKESGAYRWWVIAASWQNGTAKDSVLGTDSDAFKTAAEIYKAFRDGRANVDYEKAGGGTDDAKAAGGGGKKSAKDVDEEIPF